MSEGSYNFREIEKRWRNYWLEAETFKTCGPGEEGFNPEQPKFYILDMFPYTSGSGLHMGHPKGYIASDIYCRYKRMCGFNVLHPMGFDSFGLPAEQYARENNIHPSVATERNIETIRGQLQFLGMAYDWDREIATSRQNYYCWTQWIFHQIFSSWFDRDCRWKDGSGRDNNGKARPIAELISAFATGQRGFSEADKKVLGEHAKKGWEALDEGQQAAVLNNYRLAYQQEVMVNWCPALGTVLANEEVTNEGRSERGDHPVYQRPLRQWMMRITDYADRLLEDLDAPALPDGRGTFRLEWPESIKLMQRNWIGRSAGTEVLFDILRPGSQEVADGLKVFTTRPDTLFGVTFMVVAPQHPLIVQGSDHYLVPREWPRDIDARWKGADSSLEIRQAVAAYIEEGNIVTRRESQEKTGIFSGIMARNPVNDRIIPIFVGDYVSMEYGSGAIMAVPAHDERDFEFACKYGLEIVRVVEGPEGIDDECYAGDGISINSPAAGKSNFAINSLPTPEAKAKIAADLERVGRGRRAVNYKLRDWIFSRQWYWGEPFPVAERPEGFSVATEMPVYLPEMEDFQPHTSEDPNRPVTPPLSRAGDDWRKVLVQGVECRREINVMPQWAGSCWYYLRFIDPSNDQVFCQERKEKYFMPVDLYIGGAEHAVLHLLYSRFWHKVLFDLGHVSTAEPFKKLFNQGMITADAFADERGVYVDIREVEFREGEPFNARTGEKLQRFAGKMGKRYKNGLPPEEVGYEFGVDTFRLYEMYMGPLEASAPWSMEGIRGMQRFLQRVWRNFVDQGRNAKRGGQLTPEVEKLLHQTIKKVSEHISVLRFNTSISTLIEFNNKLVQLRFLPPELTRNFLRLLAPFAPHIAEEIWEIWGFGKGNISSARWPEADDELTREETVTLPIQINGKVRGSVDVAVDIEDDDLRRMVLRMENIKRHVADEEMVKRFIVVPGRIVNIVV